MKFTKTSIEGLVIIDPAIFGDHRGHFLESYNEKEFKEVISKVCFVQDNESKSSKGVLRGLHFQKPPFAQAKLVRCIEGKVLDVAVDIRKNSKTYGQHFTTELSGKNKKQVFIPRGFAHGFVVISEFAILSYKVDNYYKPEFESGIIWNDPDLNIDWRINKTEIIASKKDKSLPTYNNFLSPFE